MIEVCRQRTPSLSSVMDTIEEESETDADSVSFRDISELDELLLESLKIETLPLGDLPLTSPVENPQMTLASHLQNQTSLLWLKPSVKVDVSDIETRWIYLYTVETFIEMQHREHVSLPHDASKDPVSPENCPKLMTDESPEAPRVRRHSTNQSAIHTPAPKALFSEEVRHYRMLDTARIHSCDRCRGTGRVICRVCSRSGHILCSHCQGRGSRSMPSHSGSPPMLCNRCHGSGKLPCQQCRSSGFYTCNACKGLHSLCTFVRLKVRWVTISAQEIVNKSSLGQLPDEVIKSVSGNVISSIVLQTKDSNWAMEGEARPVSAVSLPDLATISRNICENHLRQTEQARRNPHYFVDHENSRGISTGSRRYSDSHPGRSRIVAQQHKICAVPITECSYTKGTEDNARECSQNQKAYIYGLEGRVYIKDLAGKKGHSCSLL